MEKKTLRELKNINRYATLLSYNPAVTIMLSFAIVIAIGTIFFLFPFTAKDGHGLSFLNALFESTSAICVTGLVVVDTVTHFNLIGQIILMLLIQIGGLGIMILTFFTIYVVRRQVSLANKMLLSYMLSEDDSGQLFEALRVIVITTFIIEGCGAIFLFIGFVPQLGFSLKTLWYAIFHAVSGFCNAGFALFSDSLVGFSNNPLILLTIAFLIILGSLGFGVINNIKEWSFARHSFLKKDKKNKSRIFLSLNSKIVLIGTGFLLLFGMLVFYGLEFTNSMKNLPTWQQYLAAFFQSVTMRTAGFNSISYAHLHTGTYLFLIVLMFIGAASGGTGGGVKINTIAVIVAAFRSFARGEKKTHLNKYEVDNSRVIQAFIVFSTAIIAILLGTLVLSFTEKEPLITIFFEVVSAMGTVGVSAGITSSLSPLGRIVVIILMFWGRIGALTMLSTSSVREDHVKISWPRADISIG
jgi:trk system potassium uptake protein TrkH